MRYRSGGLLRETLRMAREKTRSRNEASLHVFISSLCDIVVTVKIYSLVELVAMIVVGDIQNVEMRRAAQHSGGTA